jgi:ferredoxin-NADP reductase
MAGVATSSTFVVLALVGLVVAAAAGTLDLWTALSRRRAFAVQERASAQLFRAKVEAVRSRGPGVARASEGWTGYKKFRVERAREIEGVVSLLLRPHDGSRLPSYLPGQFLTLRVSVPGRSQRVVRCYSLSDESQGDHYRVTVKRARAPEGRDLQPGVASSFIHDQLRDGDLIDVRAPAGRFVMDVANPRPAVLIAGGVGITPLFSMLRAIATHGWDRDLWMFYGAPTPESALWKSELEALASSSGGRLRLHFCFSRSAPDASPERATRQHAGRVSVELLRKEIPSQDLDFYVCGPPGMLDQISRELGAWGVARERVRVEAFGGASVRSVAPAPDAREKHSVTFQRSGRQSVWQPGAGTLLELAERLGVPIESNCRAGNCGSCWVGIQSGSVTHQVEPGNPADPGTCYACVAVPSSDLVVDA